MADSATAQIASERVNRLLASLSSQTRKALRSRDAEAIHDLRVAIRRFAQPLAIFEPWFASKHVPEIIRQLKALRSAAGRVRDCDIALELVAKTDAGSVEKLNNTLLVRRKAAQRGLISALRRWTEQKRAAKWRKELAEIEAPEKLQNYTWDEQARNELPRIAKTLFHSSTSAKHLHKLRIRAKKLRYALELFQHAYGDAGVAHIEQLRDVQTLLGDINDLRTARSLLREIGAGHKLMAALKRKERKKIRRFRSLWEDQFSRKEIKHWLEFLGEVPRKPIVISKAAAPVAELVTTSA